MFKKILWTLSSTKLTTFKLATNVFKIVYTERYKNSSFFKQIMRLIEPSEPTIYLFNIVYFN